MYGKFTLFKKIIAVTACAAVICSAGTLCSTSGAELPSVTVSAANQKTDDGFEYQLRKDGTIAISKYYGNAGSVVIPSEINGIAVTEISNNAFYGSKTLKTLVIPEGVHTLGNAVFRGCDNFEKITIPDSVMNLHINIFDNSGANKLTLKTIIGKTGSAAQTFAQEYNVKFVKLTEPKNPASSVSLNKKSISIGQGESFNLSAGILPKGSDSALTWASTDSNVVTVKNGRITGAGVGTAAVSVTAENGKRAVCKVNVKKAPSTVRLEKARLSLGVGESFSLSSIIPSDSAAAVRTFRTSDRSVVKMTNTSWKASFKALKKGTAWVTVRLYNGREASCRITVTDSPKSVKLNKTAVSMGVGESFTLSSIIPSGTAAAARTFRTSNSSVVKMTNTNWTGKFKAVKTGVAYVTVRLWNGLEASCKVTVRNEPSGVRVSQTVMNMKSGQTSTLSSIIPSGSAAAVRTWRTSNSKIIKMTKTNWTGSFRAVGEGTAWVTVRLYNGAEASCRIVVKQQPYAKIYLSPSNLYKNLYAYGNTNECDQCNRIADAAKTALERCNFAVKKAPRLQDMYVSIKESNEWGADLHMPIHTNGVGPAGKTPGTMCMVYNKSAENLKYARPIYEAVQAVSPGTTDYGVIERPELAELNGTNMTAVYTEVDFHDDPSIAKWIIESPDVIGEALAKGVCKAYGVPYIAP